VGCLTFEPAPVRFAFETAAERFSGNPPAGLGRPTRRCDALLRCAPSPGNPGRCWLDASESTTIKAGKLILHEDHSGASKEAL
jgi:hypothetical protein